MTAHHQKLENALNILKKGHSFFEVFNKVAKMDQFKFKYILCIQTHHLIFFICVVCYNS